MRYLALVLVVVLAAAPLCPAELVSVTGTLDTPGSPNPNTYNVTARLGIPTPFGEYYSSSTDTSVSSGTSRFQLNCTFNEDTLAVTSLDSIKFLYGDGAGDPVP